jgi:hypothetical protein
MALAVLSAPWALLLILGLTSLLSNRVDVHGAAGPIMLLFYPAIILSIVLVIMAAFGSKEQN